MQNKKIKMLERSRQKLIELATGGKKRTDQTERELVVGALKTLQSRSGRTRCPVSRLGHPAEQWWQNKIKKKSIMFL